MSRSEALLGIVNVVVLFMPIFFALFFSGDWASKQREARDRRIAEYRKSPDSHLLILN